MNPLTCTELASEENIGHLNSRSSTYNSSDNTISKEIDTENIATKDGDIKLKKSEVSPASTLRHIEKQDISDGGYGWIIVLASFLVQLPSLSVVMSWGVFQDYYEQHMFGRSPAITLQLTFVGTLGNILLNISSPFVQILLCYMGTRKTLVVGVMLASLGMILASFSSQIWHLCLALGVLYGIGTSIIYFVVISEIPKWFTKHTGIALGIASSGNGIGGLAMPLLVAILNDKLGVEWCFRVLGFINIGVGLLTCIMFRERPGETKTCPRLRDIVDFSILKDFNFLLWCIADIFLEGAYYVPFFFLPSYATYLGLSPDKGSITVALVSGLSSIGRIIAGLIADKLGHMNVTISFSVIAGLLSLFLWTFAESFIVLIIFSVFFGFFGGVFVTLTPSITAAITGKERYESGISLLLVVTTFAMFGPNLAGAIESSMPSTVTPFMSYKMFTGAMYMAGSLLLIFLKLRLTRWSLFKKI